MPPGAGTPRIRAPIGGIFDSRSDALVGHGLVIEARDDMQVGMEPALIVPAERVAVGSELVTSLKITDKIEIFAVAIIFGYAQYLFTRLIDQKANEVLKSASSRNDPSAAPQVPAGSGELSLATTSAPSRPQVTGISPAKTSRANKCAGPGRGSKERPK